MVETGTYVLRNNDDEKAGRGEHDDKQNVDIYRERMGWDTMWLRDSYL